MTMVLKDEGVWRLEGFDSFTGEEYPIEGNWRDEDTTQRHACHHVQELLRSDPDAHGDPLRLLDRIFVVRPNGTKYQWVRTVMPKW